MSIDESLKNAVDRTRTSFSSNRAMYVEHLIKYDLKKYFGKDISQEEIARRRSSLENIVGKSFDKYSEEIDGIARKGVTKGSMGLAVLNDLYAYVSNVPIANVTGLGYALFAVKTIAEIPAMYRYLKKSHDWYGAVGHYLLKPARYLLPVVGAALESGAFERMVKRRVLKEARDDFIKEFGNYEMFDERLKNHLRIPLKEAMDIKKAA